MLVAAVVTVTFLRGLRVETAQSQDNEKESENRELIGSAF
jgi:hypothetical protein